MKTSTFPITSSGDESKPRPAIGEAYPLRGSSPLFGPLDESNGESAGTPRALRALARVVNGDLCHRCGSCTGICPTGTLSLDSEDYPCVAKLSACTDCDLCIRVCPGDEFDYLGQYEKVLGVPGSLMTTHGHFVKAAVAYATDPHIREHSTSGGVITAMLLHLLETGQIDGAAVVGSDEAQLWKGKAMIARSREQILASMKSKYAICPTNASFEEIRRVPGRYALVGLPCQIHGFLKAAELDARLRSRVVLTIGLFCHAALEHDGFRVIWDSLGDKKTEVTRFVSRVGKHPGTPMVQLKDKSWLPVYFPGKQGYRPSSIETMNLLYRLYTPPRCMTCFDGLAEFADVAVGDPWLPPPERHVDWYEGWSFTLLRTERGRSAFEALQRDKKLEVVEVTAREALASNKMMIHEKRSRAFWVIEARRRKGLPIPLYDSIDLEFPKTAVMARLKTLVGLLTHFFCFHPAQRDRVLKFFLSPAGYWFFRLNYQKRKLRVWLRDSIYRLRKAAFGRR